MSISTKVEKRKRRKLSLKDKLRGTSERPRICVFRSNTNIYAQIIDDEKGITLCSGSSIDKDVNNLRGKLNKETAVKVGENLAKKALEKNIKKVVFDRNGYSYHGIIKELADACRKAGLEF